MFDSVLLLLFVTVGVQRPSPLITTSYKCTWFYYYENTTSRPKTRPLKSFRKEGSPYTRIDTKVVLFVFDVVCQPAWKASEAEGQGVKRAIAEKTSALVSVRSTRGAGKGIPASTLACRARSFFLALAHLTPSTSPSNACHAGQSCTLSCSA